MRHTDVQLLKTSAQYLFCRSNLSTCSWLSNNAREKVCPPSKQFRGHVYQKAQSFLNLPTADLSKYLLSQILYNKDGVVVLNKPYGLASTEEKTNIYDCLPFLAKNLGHKDLKIVSIPERYTSGLTILAANTIIEKAIDKCMRRTRTLQPATSKLYLSVTAGKPTTETSCNKYAIAKQRKGKHDHELILRQWANRARKRREVNVGLIGHKTVSCNEDASLLSVGTWLYQHHCSRVFLSDVLLSPVLGDNKFGPRVGTLFGKTVFIKPWNAPLSKYLPEPLLLTLHLNKGEESFIPLHHHLHEIRLMRLFNQDLDLILQASPPAHFQWTCQQLELKVPTTKECELVNSTGTEEEHE